jgi:hypothetical protein
VEEYFDTVSEEAEWSPRYICRADSTGPVEVGLESFEGGTRAARHRRAKYSLSSNHFIDARCPLGESRILTDKSIRAGRDGAKKHTIVIAGGAYLRSARKGRLAGVRVESPAETGDGKGEACPRSRPGNKQGTSPVPETR